MSIAFACEACGSPEPAWRITRVGDATVSWACLADLSAVCAALQRDNRITQLVVTPSWQVGSADG